MKIGIVGTRTRDSWADFNDIRKALFRLIDRLCSSPSLTTRDIHLISGGCKTGADKFAENIAWQYGFPITIYHTDWKTHGKASGPIRNTTIAKESDYLIACVSKDRKGGTEDTISKFVKLKGEKNLIIV